MKKFGIPKKLIRKCRIKGCNRKEFFGKLCKIHYELELKIINKDRIIK